MEINTQIDLGDHVTDILCGFKGRCMAVQYNVKFCIQFLVKPAVNVKNPESMNWRWIDEEYLKVTKKESFIPLESTADLDKFILCGKAKMDEDMVLDHRLERRLSDAIEATKDETEALLYAARLALYYDGTSTKNLSHLNKLWIRLGGDPEEIKK